MNVHIVLWEDRHIIPRMTQWLIEAHGWTCGNEPDPRADVNYFMPYLKWSMETHPATRTAAWFTHYEKGTGWKMDRWSDASVFIDAPLVTAPMYLPYLERAQLVTPGVDLDLFIPGARPQNERPIVGIVGVGQPRKGPHLILDLFYADLECYVAIIGDNWPFPHLTQVESWEMPVFYHGIDVFLCTSSIEGIPAPVLEALACDKKIVVPHGVGICDLLPEMTGIRHYSKGNGHAMMQALKLAIEDEPEPGLLRDVVANRFTKQHWIESNLLAVEALCDADVLV